MTTDHTRHQECRRRLRAERDEVSVRAAGRIAEQAAESMRRRAVAVAEAEGGSETAYRIARDIERLPLLEPAADPEGE